VKLDEDRHRPHRRPQLRDLAGHPKLKNDLRRPTLEEIGYRAAIFSLEGFAGSGREYIDWLLSECAAEGVTAREIIEPEACELLAERLTTPLQIQQHLTLALEAGFQVGEKPVTAAVVESALGGYLFNWEATLTRNGYGVRALCGVLHTKPQEVQALLNGKLEAARAQELHEQMLTAGLPVM
jgi:hypothetical protein